MGRRSRSRKPKFPEGRFQTRIEALSHEGRGIAHVDGLITFIDGALPGEEVVFEYTGKKKQYAEGRVVEVLQASSERVDPGCPHFGVCGGCSLQHLDPEVQIANKQATLVEQMRRLGGVEVPELIPPLVGPRWGYRRKARLGVRYVEKKERVLVGFRERQSRFIADLQRCPVLHSAVGERLEALSALIGAMESKRVIPQIEVALGDEEVALVFRHMQPLPEADRRLLLEFAKTEGVGILLQSGGPDTVQALWPETAGALHYSLPDYGLEMGFAATDFTQVNLDINRAMIRQALDLLDPQPGERVLDLFCGLGNFTLPIARSGAEVIGVEGDSALVAKARANAERNGLTDVRFFTADLTQDLSSEPWVGQGFDKILFDPPRSGALEFLPYLKKMAPRRILYVSCNPATLARDAGELVKTHGYRLLKAGVMDMFPHTAHVESIALFERVD